MIQPIHSQTVYLDYNATAPLRPEARDAVMAALSVTGNPSSMHGFGRAARRMVEESRDAVAALVGVPPAQIVFTSGGTEANALALHGPAVARRRVLVSAIEHPSVLACAGGELIPALADGRVDLAALDRMLADSERPTVVSIMAANNETGVIQPIREIAAIARERGALVHCDAVQAAGKIAIDFDALGVDMLSLSAHKIGGPPGIGALVVRDGVPLPALIRGGGQERGRRSGTENLPGIAGFGAAAVAARAGVTGFAGLADMRDGFERRLLEFCPTAVLFGHFAPRLANTSCVAMPGVPAETQLMGFDLAGIAVSSGSACSSGKVASSHVLDAMGASADEKQSAIRVSLGWETRPEDLDAVLAAWTELSRRAGTNAAA